MFIAGSDYPKSADVHKHEGVGEFGVETILTREQLGSAGRLFVRGTLKSGHSVGMHAHNGDMEVCYFLSGEGLVREPDAEYIVRAGDTNIIPSGGSHEIINNGTDDLVYLAVVLFPEDAK